MSMASLDRDSIRFCQSRGIPKPHGPARSNMRHVWPHAPHFISRYVGPSTTIRDRRIRDVTFRFPHMGHRPEFDSLIFKNVLLAQWRCG